VYKEEKIGKLPYKTGKRKLHTVFRLEQKKKDSDL
jgi:hypothetical protein